MGQRNSIFQATRNLLQLLLKSLDKGDHPVTLNKQLLRRIVKAAMECPGFTVHMKDDIAWIAGMPDGEQLCYGQPRFASSWCHQYAVVPKPGMPLDMVEVRFFFSSFLPVSPFAVSCNSLGFCPC